MKPGRDKGWEAALELGTLSYGARPFLDSVGICPFSRCIAAAIKILTFPVSNPQAETVFGDVSLAETELTSKSEVSLRLQ